MAQVDPALIKRNKQALKSVEPLFQQLNDSWESIETFFRKQGVLRPCQISYSELWVETPDGGHPIGIRLMGIQKFSGKWRICQADSYNGESDVSWTPITDCSVEIRIDLLKHVEKLFEKLVKSNEDFIPEMQLAVAKSEEVLRNLGLVKGT